jgi:hypothetical protein
MRKKEHDEPCFKADPSLKSLIVTLKNLHDLTVQRFALKVDEQHQTIECNSKRSPDFGDIAVQDHDGTNTDNHNFRFGKEWIGFEHRNTLD